MMYEATDIGRFTANIQSRAELLLSLCEDERAVAAIETLSNNCIQTIIKGGKIVLCGNGGFAAIAQHVASELVGKLHGKRNPLPAFAIGTDMSVSTCIANDFGFEQIFSRQFEALCDENDLLIALTTSGKSKNILQILSQARIQNTLAFVFTGLGNGTLCQELGAYVIELPTSETEAIQDLAMITLHLICSQIEESLKDVSNLDSHSIWDSIIEVGKTTENKTIILDRDGVINHLVPNDYVITEDDLCMNKEFLSICPALNESFDRIFIVTNQACIGKGIAETKQIEYINALILDSIRNAGGRVDGIYTCTDADSDSHLRKPNTGILDVIRQDYPAVDFTKSVIVGDSYSDELFAQRIGAMYFNINNV